jgi:hypothetical protein
MKARVIFEFEVGDLIQFADPNNNECKSNIIDIFHGMVLELMDMKEIAISLGSIHQKEHIAAIEDDITLAKRIMNGLKFIGGIDEHTENTA